MLATLRDALAPLGLNILLPLDAAAFDAACAPVLPSLRLATLLPGAAGAVVVGSGGPAFFDRFAAGAREAGDGAPDPLDRYTARVVADAVRAALEPRGARHAVVFPFLRTGGLPHVPFQRLGRAAGLGVGGPLGLQIHPTFGPWWAYRALVVLAERVDAAAASSSSSSPSSLRDVCAGCPAPCVAACPAGAVRTRGFVVPTCHAHRLRAEPCRSSCAARIACVVGPEHRYRDEELAFHMRASMPRPPLT